MENKQNIKDLIQKFYPHAKEKLGFDHPVRVIMRQDAENAQQSLGKTAYYDPAEKLIVLYVTNRHPKDVLRSFSHELVHHAQNCRGELDDLTADGHYAKDGKGREIEEEAYLQGNLNLRDYEDSIKFEGVNEMKLTKSQLKGLIEQTIKKITEKKEEFPDFTGDGEVTQADILKARGVKLKEDEPSKEDRYARSKGLKRKDLDHMRASKGSVEKAEEEHEEKTGLKKMPVKRTGLGLYRGRADEAEMDEQEMVVKADVKLPPEAQRVLDTLDDFINQADAESAELQAVVSAIMQKLQDKDVEYANPTNTLDVDEMHCGGKRDDDLEEQEMKPTIKGKDTTPEPERKVGKGAEEMLKVAKDAKKSEEEKAITKSTGMKIDESNDTWYNSTLYESLKTKWTKKGDK